MISREGMRRGSDGMGGKEGAREGGGEGGNGREGKMQGGKYGG